jgi:hypothetical protein
VFEAFGVEVRFDKAERRIEITATVSEAVADAFQNAKDLQKEVPCVATNGIAGPDMSVRATHRGLWTRAVGRSRNPPEQ